VTIYTDKELPERREADHYPTPRWAVEAAMETICDSFVVEESWPVSILDVGAGDGIWGTVAREVFKEGVQITGIELRDLPKPEAYNNWLTADFFDRREQLAAMGPFDLIMGNPPFGYVESIIDYCWPLLSPPVDCKADMGGNFWGGRLAFFLRLAFLEGQRRRDGLFKEHPLTTLGVYSKRVSFQADGKTNATAHALFLWQLGHPGFRSGLRFF
jgi:hypothetical protein